MFHYGYTRRNIISVLKIQEVKIKSKISKGCFCMMEEDSVSC